MATLAIAQKNNSNSNTVVSPAALTCVFTSAQTAGSCNVVVVQFPAGKTVSVSDSVNGTYTLAAGPTTDSGGNFVQAIYIKPNIASASASGNTVSATLNSGTNFLELRIYEISGAATSSPSDVTAVNTGNSNSPTISITTVTANTLILACFSYDNTGPNNSGPSFTLQQFTGFSDEDDSKLVTSAGTYTDNQSSGLTQTWVAQAIAIKQASTTSQATIAKAIAITATERILRITTDAIALGRTVTATPKIIYNASVTITLGRSLTATSRALRGAVAAVTAGKVVTASGTQVTGTRSATLALGAVLAPTPTILWGGKATIQARIGIAVLNQQLGIVTAGGGISISAIANTVRPSFRATATIATGMHTTVAAWNLLRAHAGIAIGRPVRPSSSVMLGMRLAANGTNRTGSAQVRMSIGLNQGPPLTQARLTLIRIVLATAAVKTQGHAALGVGMAITANGTQSKNQSTLTTRMALVALANLFWNGITNAGGGLSVVATGSTHGSAGFTSFDTCQIGVTLVATAKVLRRPSAVIALGRSVGVSGAVRFNGNTTVALHGSTGGTGTQTRAANIAPIRAALVVLARAMSLIANGAGISTGAQVTAAGKVQAKASTTITTGLSTLSNLAFNIQGGATIGIGKSVVATALVRHSAACLIALGRPITAAGKVPRLGTVSILAGLATVARAFNLTTAPTASVGSGMHMVATATVTHSAALHVIMSAATVSTQHVLRRGSVGIAPSLGSLFQGRAIMSARGTIASGIGLLLGIDHQAVSQSSLGLGRSVGANAHVTNNATVSITAKAGTSDTANVRSNATAALAVGLSAFLRAQRAANIRAVIAAGTSVSAHGEPAFFGGVTTQVNRGVTATVTRLSPSATITKLS